MSSGGRRASNSRECEHSSPHSSPHSPPHSSPHSSSHSPPHSSSHSPPHSSPHSSSHSPPHSSPHSPPHARSQSHLLRADSPVLGFDGEHSDDPLRFPSPNFPPRDLCLPQLRASHPRNAVYLAADDASALFPRCVSVASSIDSYSENKIAALDHIRVLYSSPSQVHVGPAPEPTSSRWSTTSSMLDPPCQPVRPKKRKRLTSFFSRLLGSPSTAAIAEPREMQKAYLARDDPPIALDLRKRTLAESYIDLPGTPADLSLDSLTFRRTPSLDSLDSHPDPEPPSSRIGRQLAARRQQSTATLTSCSTSSTSSSFSLSTTPPLSPSKPPRKAFSIPARFSFRPRSRVPSLVSSSPPLSSPAPPKPLTIRLSTSTRPVDVVLPPSPRGPPPPPPVPPKDFTPRPALHDDAEYLRARGSGLDDRGRVLVLPGLVDPERVVVL